ncbi:Asp-tRNA(Asn)/Glu-tRNA(Gln) amidotransferase A subunit family amidase [Mesorhizobium sp. J18]|uniref:amidase n=1 Tax=Mesorhizobium sp. J18 TaxID=935263 RepID=UPI00119C611B|nr:amidase [Mesorhizobium sp. J18]TWG97915.1 Asp-tRNA(Asn)/Glu-tRNA(Gln) amidotransferase A subunit family amidase [Mesorhizobium sp. J18]
MTIRKPDRKFTELGATALADMVGRGAVKAEAVTQAFLDRIADEDEALGAWAHVDADYALRQARALDLHRSTGRAVGPLHGVPIGIKDIIDVRGLPCENGTMLDAGRMPGTDAFIVSRLRQAGAVILGKTVTTELAVYHPGKTRNPHDPGRTPGGSSSGSAAAVAAHLAPLAVGTQTNGSIIRPASYCGIVGYKPSRGLVSRSGILSQSPTLDTVGLFARNVEDAVLLGDVLADFDPQDRAMQPSAPPRLAAIANSPPPLRPNLALVRTSVWDEADEDVKAGFEELSAALGNAMDSVDLPEPFARAHDMHKAIMLADIAKSFASYYEYGREQLSTTLAGMIAEGRRVLAVDYALAHDWIEVLNAALDRLFERFDAIVTPAATGEAPIGLETTGSPVFATLWTFCGVPAVTLPLLSGSSGLPIGVQLVGRRGDDARLLRTARWLVGTLRQEAAGTVPHEEPREQQQWSM